MKPVPGPHRYRLAPGTFPLRRCVGAYRRTCLMSTTAVLCDPCWALVLSGVVGVGKAVARRHRPSDAVMRAIREGRPWDE